MTRLIVLVLMVALVVVVVAKAARTTRELTEPRAGEVQRARWKAAHFSLQGHTHVVVRRVVPGSGAVLDEREVATVPDDDLDYDARFGEAMATARSRAALFDQEED